MTDEHDLNGHIDYDCLDPALGDQLWLLGAPDCPEDLRVRLEHHAMRCAACRLDLAVERKVGEGLRRGDLVLVRQARFGGLAGGVAGAGAAALAAGLALLLLLPPTAPHEALVLRGGEGPAIERPVAEEVVRGDRPTLRWTPLSGASHYEVRVQEVGGDYTWTGSSREAAVTVPPDAALPVGSRFRVLVEPVPAHLAPAGGMRSSFRTGGTGDWIAHRLRRGAAPGRWLGGLGLAGLLAGLTALAALRPRR